MESSTLNNMLEHTS